MYDVGNFFELLKSRDQKFMFGDLVEIRKQTAIE
jgi:hypothetical protein